MNKPSSSDFSTQDVKILLKEYYNLEASVKPLDSYWDQNFLVIVPSGKKFVFKIANLAESRDVLDLQNKVMQFLTNCDLSIASPTIQNATNGKEMISIKDHENTPYLARLLTFLDGTFLSKIQQPTKALLLHFGYVLGRMDKALQDFHHPSAQRRTEWDLKNTTDLSRYLNHIVNRNQRRLVEYYLQLFENEVAPVLPQLRQSVIHNDGNDHNILVGEGKVGKKMVIGIIDFGDVVKTQTIFELATAATYVMLGKADPLKDASYLIQGYHKAFPVTKNEIEILFFLIATRLCASVLLSSQHKILEPNNEYITISEKPALALLNRFLEINPIQAQNIFWQACGLKKLEMLKGFRKEKTLEIRNRHIGKSLSLSYKEPLKIVRGAMQYLYDDKGNTFLDCVNNVCHVGHCHPSVVKAAQKQMSVLNTNTRYLHDYLVKYAQRLTEKLPDSLSVCYIVNSGSEANDLALRLAHSHTKRKDIIVVDGAYHGNLSSLIEISPYKFDGPGGKGSPSHVHIVMMPDTFRGKYKTDNPASAKNYASQVQRTISDIQTKGKGLAAFICEPLLSCGGQIVLPDNYLKLAYGFVRNAGGVCIADEVQIGFGRMGSHFWGFETQGVVPDIVTLGKPIGNGHPLGAVVTTPEIAESFNNGMEYFNTFGGNPISCAVGLAVLDVIEKEKLQENAFDVGVYFKNGLQQLMMKYPLIGAVRGLGLFLGLELVLDRETLVPAVKEAKIIIEEMKNRGVLLSIDGPLYNVLKIKPPLVFTKTNVDVFIQNLHKVLSKLSY